MESECQHRRRARTAWRHCPSSFPQKAPALFSLSSSMGEDNMAGENGHGGPMPDHSVDVLEPPSLSPFPDSEPLVPGQASSFSSIVVPTWIKFSVLPRWTERGLVLMTWQTGRTEPRGSISGSLWCLLLLTLIRGEWKRSEWLGCEALAEGTQEETCQQQKSEKGTDMSLGIQKSKSRGTQQNTSVNSWCFSPALVL